MFTAMAALEAGTINLSTRILDSGSLSLDHGEGRIYDSDKRANGYMEARDIVAYSRNVGAARIALGLANTTAKASKILAGAWLRFGFGQKTGVDLAGEAAGLVRDPALKRWSQVDLANGSFGQGVAVTELQLATGYAAMINGGTLVTPHVVLGVGDRDVEPVDRGRVISPGLSKSLVDLMGYVVPHGPVVCREDARPGLPDRRQDRDGPDLGPEAQPRTGRLEGEPLQPHVRRLHRQGPSAARHRGHRSTRRSRSTSPRATCPSRSSRTSCSGAWPPMR